jgi:serine/threonine protein kinase
MRSKEDSERIRDKFIRKKKRGQILTEQDESDLAAAVENLRTQKSHMQTLRREQRNLFAKLAVICEEDFPEIPAIYPEEGLVKHFFEMLPSLYVPLRLFENYDIQDPPLSMTPKSRHNVYRASFDGKVPQTRPFSAVLHSYAASLDVCRCVPNVCLLANTPHCSLQACALKEYNIASDSDIKSLQNELSILSRLSHPCILQIQCFFVELDNRKAYVELPLCNEGNLGMWLEAGREVSDVHKALHQVCIFSSSINPFFHVFSWKLVLLVPDG